MGISANYTKNRLTIELAGKLDLTRYRDFRESYQSLSDKPEEIILDMSETTYMDSSAMGMLLLLRDYAGDTVNLSIINPSEVAKKILALSMFETLFDVREE